MKKSKLLLAAGILGTVYLIYLIGYFSTLAASAEGTIEELGRGIAVALVTPHMLCVGIAVIFNWLGWALKARWAALVAGIMYAVAILCMFLYAIFVVLEMIFCFVAFAQMKQTYEQSERRTKTEEPIRRLELTSKDLVRAEGMMDYCNFFNFANGAPEELCFRLFKSSEPYISPDQEVVMSFISTVTGESGDYRACVFSATKFIIASSGSVDIIPVPEIDGFSMEEKGLISIIKLESRTKIYEFWVEKGTASGLFQTCKKSLIACKEELEQTRDAIKLDGVK